MIMTVDRRIEGTSREWYLADKFRNLYFVTLPLVHGGPATFIAHKHGHHTKLSVTFQIDVAPACHTDSGELNGALSYDERVMMDAFSCQVGRKMARLGILEVSDSPQGGHIW